MISERDFLQNKENVLEKLDEAKKRDLVDQKIIPIVELLNNVDSFYTTSSCAGRIVLLVLPEIGDKKNAEMLSKWHRTIGLEELKSALGSSDKKGQIWLIAQSPIFHVACKTLDDADRLLKICVDSGFKHSGLKSISKKIIVEILSTERLDFPIGNDDSLFCDDRHLDFLIDASNEVINRSDDKIMRLQKALKKKI
ncbi:MAG: hypothetical protein V5A64_00605 [Candidatus Thermoplasmatota archaeon]